MTVDADVFRSAMRQWASGVAVVTSAYEGRVHGMTVSSFTSVSLSPALVLVSLAKETRTHALVQESLVFGVSLLSLEQAEVSDRFAGRVADAEDRMQGLNTFTLESPVPLLEGAAAQFDCRVVSQIPAGTHTLFIGEVLAAKSGGDASPLVYYNRGYRRLLDA